MITKRISITGIVQGVGFRPFVYGLATRFDLRGWVRNTSAGVEIVVQGDPDCVRGFVESFSAEIPPLARIDRLKVQDEAGGHFERFEIRESDSVKGAFQPISADIALCPDCERELLDPQDRRYLYPFINCTNCGPRFTIIKDIPYDRPKTTMADFTMCGACEGEYRNPLDRRFHAQPVACPQCGPHVWLALAGKSTWSIGRAAILETRRMLSAGKIVAVKGLGGFHLACDASNDAAVDELRRRKGRIGKPFALMAASLAALDQLVEMTDAERGILSGREKPIVILKKKTLKASEVFRVSDGISPGVATLGVMLPYTPLHHLLLNQTDPVLAEQPAPFVLVMTSGNFNEEPIATDNQDALERLAPLADAFLLHDRDIHIRCDDSVVRVDHRLQTTDHKIKSVVHSQSSVVYLRRSRGYAPYPVNLPFKVKPTLAVGGELKNTFCLTRDKYAFLSHHIGDMENAETYKSFEQGVEHLCRLFRVRPKIIAYDLHPNYFTTQYAKRNSQNAKTIAVQHHHAHIAACMADNGLENKKVIGLAFDGTGYGIDGTIWGGEFLLASYADFERVAHLEYLPLPGGDAAIRKPWRIAVGYAAALGLKIDDLPFVRAMDGLALAVVRAQVEKNLNVALTSSMGRLFDCVAALAGVRAEITYEAQAAIELETLSKPYLSGAKPYPYGIEETGGEMIIRVGELLSAVAKSARDGEAAGRIGARFHKTIATLALDVCRRIRQRTGLAEAALSGGVWQNQLLLDLARSGLEKDGFTVYFHKQTPTNDGGLALGQAVVANFQKPNREGR